MPAYDWRQLATMHRPTDPAALAKAARQLAAQGLKPRDISTTLGLSTAAVITLLQTAATTQRNSKQ